MTTKSTASAQAAYEAGYRAGNIASMEPIPAEHAADKDAYTDGYLAGLDTVGQRITREFATPLRRRFR